MLNALIDFNKIKFIHILHFPANRKLPNHCSSAGDRRFPPISADNPSQLPKIINFD
jgi:hypothetical protein